jgi:hypothetical protein
MNSPPNLISKTDLGKGEVFRERLDSVESGVKLCVLVKVWRRLEHRAIVPELSVKKKV